MHLDPRTRILLVSLFSVLVFIIDQLPVAAALMLSFFLLRLTLKVPFRSVKSWRTLSMLVFFVILVQILFGPGENYIISPLFPASFPVLGGMGSLKWDGLLLGLVIGCRLVSLMLLLSLFIETTPPHQIAQGLASFGFNYRTAFIITTAFNLIPLFEEQGHAIMDAQKLRGVKSFEEGSFFVKLKAYPPLVVPLVLSAMRKAQLAGIAMDSRAFGVYKTRTWIDKSSMNMRDYLSLAICSLFAALTLWINYVLK